MVGIVFGIVISFSAKRKGLRDSRLGICVGGQIIVVGRSGRVSEVVKGVTLGTLLDQTMFVILG